MTSLFDSVGAHLLGSEETRATVGQRQRDMVLNRTQWF